MAESAQRDLSELINLVGDLAEVTLTEARTLLNATDALDRRNLSVRAPKPLPVITELQEVFRRLTQCVFTFREDTDRLQRITRTGFGSGRHGPTSDNNSQ